MNSQKSSTLNQSWFSVLNMTMGQRLKEALDARQRTPPDVIRGCRLSKGAVYNILNDATTPGKVRASTIRLICEFLMINRDWLVWGRGHMDDPNSADEAGDWPDIMGYKVAAALGDSSVPDEYAETHKLKFRADSLRRKGLRADRLAVIYGRGESMTPTINDGDAILFDRDDTKPADGKLYVITYDGDLLAKRLMEIEGSWFAVSDNDSDPKWRKPRRLDPSRGIEIAGRIRWVAGWVD